LEENAKLKNILRLNNTTITEDIKNTIPVKALDLLKELKNKGNQNWQNINKEMQKIV
jgi:hypothetical protein